MKGRLNIVSKEYTGAKTITAHDNRGYLFIICTSGAISVAVGSGGTGGKPLASGAFWEPYIAPIGKLTITGTGTYTVVTNRNI